MGRLTDEEKWEIVKHYEVGWFEKLARIIWGNPMGTIREPDLRPEDAIRINREDIDYILKNTKIDNECDELHTKSRDSLMNAKSQKLPKKNKFIYTSCGFGVPGLSEETIKNNWESIVYLINEAREEKRRSAEAKRQGCKTKRTCTCACQSPP